jgi:hypothetical protein
MSSLDLERTLIPSPLVFRDTIFVLHGAAGAVEHTRQSTVLHRPSNIRKTKACDWLKGGCESTMLDTQHHAAIRSALRESETAMWNLLKAVYEEREHINDRRIAH